MRTNWALVAGIVAVLSVPFALAVLEDTADEQPEERPPEPARLEPPSPPPKPPPPADEEPGARWQDVQAMSLDFFDEVFFAGEGARAPALSGPLAGADFGMSRGDITGAAPRLVDWASAGSSRYPELLVSLLDQAPGARLSGIRLSFPDDGTARRVFASRWGPPQGEVGPRLWLNPELGVRLVLNDAYAGQVSAELQPYWPLEAIVAPEDRETFGFERIPLLGASREEVARAHREDLLPAAPDGSSLSLRFPPVAFARGPTEVTLELNGERVAELRFSLDCSYVRSCEDELVSLFERKLGRPRSAGAGRLELAGGGRRITLEPGSGGATARVRARSR